MTGIIAHGPSIVAVRRGGLAYGRTRTTSEAAASSVNGSALLRIDGIVFITKIESVNEPVSRCNRLSRMASRQALVKVKTSPKQLWKIATGVWSNV